MSAPPLRPSPWYSKACRDNAIGRRTRRRANGRERLILGVRDLHLKDAVLQFVKREGHEPINDADRRRRRRRGQCTTSGEQPWRVGNPKIPNAQIPPVSKTRPPPTNCPTTIGIGIKEGLRGYYHASAIYARCLSHFPAYTIAAAT